MDPNYNEKIPFYMTYPMQNAFLEEAEYEKDMNMLKAMFPKEVKEIQAYVEDECDKMEYEGSLMFDEYPDRLLLRQIRNRIYEKVIKPEEVEACDYEIEMEELRFVGPGRQYRRGNHFLPPLPPRYNPGLTNLIDVLLLNEVYQRRCRHRRCRRWW
jgi:hypothetical protein